MIVSSIMIGVQGGKGEEGEREGQGERGRQTLRRGGVGGEGMTIISL